MTTQIYRYMLWGYHPSLRGPAGVVPVKLAGGDRIGYLLRRARDYEASYPGIKTGIYTTGQPPEGLRAQCRADGYQ